MTHGETQDAAWSPACRRMKTNLREQYTPPKVPNWPAESPPPPSPIVTREEMVNPGENELHSVAHSKVKTNPRTRSTPRKIKDVRTHEETQSVARSPCCCSRMKVNLRESHTGPQSPDGQPRPHHHANPRWSNCSDREAHSQSQPSTQQPGWYTNKLLQENLSQAGTNPGRPEGPGSNEAEFTSQPLTIESFRQGQGDHGLSGQPVLRRKRIGHRRLGLHRGRAGRRRREPSRVRSRDPGPRSCPTCPPNRLPFYRKG